MSWLLRSPLQLSKGSLRRKSLQGNVVAEKLDSLLVLTFEHLESCQSSGRLAEVFSIHILETSYCSCILLSAWWLYVGQFSLLRYSKFF